MKGKGILALVSLAIAFLVAACAPSAAPSTPPKLKDKPIKFGFIAETTGFARFIGEGQVLAAQLAVEDINKAGGINGYPLQLIQTDDASDPKATVGLVRKLAEEDKVPAIIGPGISTVSKVALPVANDLKTPIVCTSCGEPGMTKASRPYGFRTYQTGDITTIQSLDWWVRQYKTQKVAIITDAKDAISSFFGNQVIPNRLKELGVEVLDPIVTYNSGDMDVSAQVTRVKGMNPGALAVSSLTMDVLTVAKELNRQGVMERNGVKLPFYQGAGSGIPSVLAAGGPLMEGWVTGTNFFWGEQRPEVQDYVARFKARQPQNLDPGQTDTGAYEAVMIAARVAIQAGITPDTPLQEARDKIMQGLDKLKDYQGMQGKASMVNGDFLHPVHVIQVQKGQYVEVK